MKTSEVGSGLVRRGHGAPHILSRPRVRLLGERQGERLVGDHPIHFQDLLMEWRDEHFQAAKSSLEEPTRRVACAHLGS